MAVYRDFPKQLTSYGFKEVEEIGLVNEKVVFVKWDTTVGAFDLDIVNVPL